MGVYDTLVCRSRIKMANLTWIPFLQLHPRMSDVLTPVAKSANARALALFATGVRRAATFLFSELLVSTPGRRTLCRTWQVSKLTSNPFPQLRSKSPANVEMDEKFA